MHADGIAPVTRKHLKLSSVSNEEWGNIIYMQTLLLTSLTLCGCAHVGGSTCVRVKGQPVGVRVTRMSFRLSGLGARAVTC